MDEKIPNASWSSWRCYLNHIFKRSHGCFHKSISSYLFFFFGYYINSLLIAFFLCKIEHQPQATGGQHCFLLSPWGSQAAGQCLRRSRAAACGLWKNPMFLFEHLFTRDLVGQRWEHLVHRPWKVCNIIWSGPTKATAGRTWNPINL